MAHEALWEKKKKKNLGVMVQGNDVGERGHGRGGGEKEPQLSVRFSLFFSSLLKSQTQSAEGQ